MDRTGGKNEPPPGLKRDWFRKDFHLRYCVFGIKHYLCSTYLSTYDMITATYTDLRSNLKEYLDRVVKDSDNVIVNRGNGSAVVIMSMEEYESMVETAYVMSQPDLVDAIRQGDEDVKNGNYEVVNVDEL